MNFFTLYTILVTFSPEISEFTLLTVATFVLIWQKILKSLSKIYSPTDKFAERVKKRQKLMQAKYITRSAT